ncbi:hypothetical protein DY000_02057848 [Brassica cretica]|uniref:Phosphofructokinase domain-containing protein n=1 Tax=Brassica cretica TaxID=69181 RepID=A0ABQ7AKK3_BRACR|nr:hypothetical protein DY000_02057848 [Brassica cretica]
MIGNVMIDARSTGKYYHFVRLMGRAASHITLECALQTHPNITIIGEEVQELIAELNEILANEVVDESGLWKKKLTEQSLKLFDLLPEAIQEQLMLERDPHGNVQVAKIETEKMLIQMVETELEKRKQTGSYKGQFMGQSHFFGYEGRCGLPTNFDATYCYALGYGAGVLLNSGKTGLISSVGNLAAPVEEWTVGGTALTALMDVERRHGKFKPVIKKAMVELEAARGMGLEEPIHQPCINVTWSELSENGDVDNHSTVSDHSSRHNDEEVAAASSVTSRRRMAPMDKAPPFGSQEAQLFFRQNLRNCIPDEHYIQTLLTMRGLESEVEPRTLTYTVWNVSGTKHGAKSWHPVTFTFENSGPEDIQEIKRINHVNYESESRIEWCTADSKPVPCFLFARKFTNEAAMRLVSEVLIGSSKNVAL